MAWTIGASEAAKPLGLSPYDSPFSWWLKKTKRAPEDPQDRATMWGNRLEGPILDDFEARHDVRLIRCDCGAGLRDNVHTAACSLPPMFHPVHTWMRATPDGILIRRNCSASFIERFEMEADESIPVDAKSAAMVADIPRFVLDRRWGEPGSDEVPQEYAVQMQQQMKAADACRPGFCRRGIVTALIAGRDTADFWLPAEPKFQAWMIERLEDIIATNLEFDMPFDPADADDWDRARTALYMRQPTAGKKRRAAVDDEAAMLAEYFALKTTTKAADERLKELRGRLTKAVGSDYAIDSDTHTATYTEGAASESGWAGRSLLVTEKKAKKP